MIKQNLLRYMIAFHISDRNADKQKLFSVLEKAGWKQEHIIQEENDLYDYIKDLVKDTYGNDVASSWKLSKELYTKKRFVTKVNNQNVKWRFERIGLVLFSTGVGILWYEINIDKLTEITQIMDIAYALKELARGDREKNYIQRSEVVKGEDNVKLVELEKNTSDEIFEKKSTPQGLVIKKMEKISLFNDVLWPFISGVDIDSYFANRGEENSIKPDHAIAFTWGYEMLKEGSMDDLDKAFHLGRIYNPKYDMSSRVDEADFYIPFEDSVWYACLEGCANYTCPNHENNFYIGGYIKRLNTYFYLYILCLGQYYSLLQFAQEVSMLPTEETKYFLKDDCLEFLLDKIHVFKLKNNYSQVGHLTQHNEFYEYVQRRLGINKMQQELEMELQALFEMIERKKSIRQAKNYKVLSIIGGIFVVLQAFINVAAMYGSVMSQKWGYFIFATVGCIVLAILGVILWLIDRIKHDKK